MRNHTIWLQKKQEHDELKLKQAESVHSLAIVKQQQLELVSIGHFVRAFEGGKGLIIQKVTDALKEFPGIKAKSMLETEAKSCPVEICRLVVHILWKRTKNYVKNKENTKVKR